VSRHREIRWHIKAKAPVYNQPILWYDRKAKNIAYIVYEIKEVSTIDPKVLILVAVIFAAVVIAVLAVMHIAEKLKGTDSNKFKCVHCKGRYPVSDKDSHFGSDMCTTCGEFLIPHSSRAERSN